MDKYNVRTQFNEVLRSVLINKYFSKSADNHLELDAD